MAKAGARKRLEENGARLRMLLGLMVLGSGTFLAVRLLMYKEATTFGHWVGLTVTLLVEGFTYAAIAVAAQPVYDGSGTLIDGGADLNKGMVSSYHDVFYISVMVQLVAAFTKWGWYIYLILPSYGLWYFWTKVFRPAVFPDEGGQPAVDAATMKKMERAEQRSQRRQQKRF